MEGVVDKVRLNISQKRAANRTRDEEVMAWSILAETTSSSAFDTE